MKEKVIILDFGSQYTQLIARRIRELNVYCEIQPYNQPIKEEEGLKAVILSGSPFSVKEENALKLPLKGLLGRYPVLAICYGAQLLADQLGGQVERSQKREYGKAHLHKLKQDDPLFQHVPESSQVWMSHADHILHLPKGYEVVAGTESIEVAAFRKREENSKQAVYGLQFHPEVSHTEYGKQLLKNFLRNIAGCKAEWTPASFVRETIENIRKQVGGEGVLLGLSGGVDSSVAAALLHRALGDQLVCFFIDNGLLRKGEYEEVLHSYRNMGLNIVGVDAKEEFYQALKGLSDPEAKRKAIGRTFVEVFQREAAKLPDIQWLAQGTIYPDVIESVSVHGPSVTIKSHHNVGGLPDILHLKIIEPLRMLFKDEVRRVGRELQLPEDILGRHPFPGPGLAIRILGEVTAEKVALLQEADAIFIGELRREGLYERVWQAATILLPIQSVGVMGDERTYEKTVVLRAVNSLDGMTAEWSRLPHDFLARVSNRIINQVHGINRVVYDISTKPPATIEWE